MKKMFKVIATVAAILSMANFVACKSDDDGDDEKVAVTSVTLNQSTATVEAGKTVTLTATVAPENATNKTVTWASSNTGIATVDGGVVTGVAAGEATITATADGKSATATITVTAASTDSGDSGSTDSGSGDSGSSETTSIDASWDFSTSPDKFPTSDAATDAVTDLSIAVTSGSGATLTATGRWKFNSGLQAQATSGVTVSDIASDSWLGDTSKAKYLTLTLEKASKVTVVFCGAGSADTKRFVGLLNSSNEVSWSEGSLTSETPVTKTAELEAGTYKIAANGSRINSIKCE